jgi:HB1, ASXL, restriction endonuclease HTH domain
MPASNDFSSIRIGSRVRHSDGVTGRIVWANATTVKVQWDDGEKVTWKRAELADKGLEILEAEDTAQEQAVVTASAESSPAEPGAPEPVEAEAESHDLPAIEPTAEKPADTAEETPVTLTSEEATSTPVVETPKKRKPRPATAEKKPSALDAAAKVLGEEARPMGCQELIGAMAGKGYWTSPGGKTPAATLYSALLREMDTKGEASRFTKVGKGMFALRPQS